MASTVIDSKIFGHLYTTERMKEIFSDTNMVQKWIDTEVALAMAQGKLGIIPQEMADEIKKKGKADLLDLEAIGENFKSSITIVPLLKEFKKVLDNNAGEFVNYGATSQDIVDNGMILQLKEAYEEIYNLLSGVEDLAYDLSEKHKDLVMAGRTHVIHALPITFGFKTAVWAAEISRHLERLRECKDRLLVGQFSGAVGTLASQEELGLEVQKIMMEDLEINVPTITWHTSRDHIAEFVNLLALIAGTIGKINCEILSLQRTEIGEIEEPFFMGKVGSSTMPHKRNPQVCENVIALTRNIRGLAPLAVEAMICEHERDWGSLLSEWDLVPRACHMMGAALEKTNDILKNLIVYPERMEENLFKLKGMILSEAVMMHLGEKIGRLTAHDVVYETCMKAFAEKKTMKEALLENELVAKHFTGEEIDDFLEPHKYTGLSSKFVDRVLNSRKNKLL